MPDSFRLRIMKAVTDQLKTATPANGYTVDLGDFLDENQVMRRRVFRGRTSFGMSDPIPMVSILEDPRVPEGATGAVAGGKVASKLRLLIQGFAADDIADPTDNAYELSANCVKALVAGKAATNNILGLDGRVTAMTIGQPIHRPADTEVSDTAYFLVGVTLTIVEDLEKPFY